jgi:hypothetical protein
MPIISHRNCEAPDFISFLPNLQPNAQQITLNISKNSHGGEAKRVLSDTLRGCDFFDLRAFLGLLKPLFSVPVCGQIQKSHSLSAEHVAMLAS